MPTREELAKVFRYDPETGHFYRHTEPDKPLGIGNQSRYLTLKMANRTYYAHRLAWIFVYGVEPAKYLDHINGDRRDNRIANLRECSHSANMINKSTQVNNKLGVKGVRLRSDGKKFIAQITLNKKNYHLGSFDTVEEAKACYEKAASEIHGQFVRPEE